MRHPLEDLRRDWAMFAPRNSSPVAIYGKEDVAAYEVKVVQIIL